MSADGLLVALVHLLLTITATPLPPVPAPPVPVESTDGTQATAATGPGSEAAGLARHPRAARGPQHRLRPRAAHPEGAAAPALDAARLRADAARGGVRQSGGRTRAPPRPPSLELAARGVRSAASDLAWVRLTFWGFDARRHTGELLVHRSAAADLVQVFRVLYRERFPQEQVGIVRRWDPDAPSTGDGNGTGVFVCRPSTGSSYFSQHAYGLAIDVNSFQNPYAKGAVVLPERASSYLERARVRAGMITPDGPGRAGLRPHRLGVGRRMAAVEGLHALQPQRPLVDPARPRGPSGWFDEKNLPVSSECLPTILVADGEARRHGAGTGPEAQDA